MTFIAYIFEDEDWRAENGAALCSDFGIPDGNMEAELPRWHGALHLEKDLFALLRRLYGLHPLLGVEDPDEMRPWSAQELATQRGAALREIEAQVDSARDFWRRWKMQHAATPASLKAEERPMPAALSEEDAKRLLMEHGFIGVTNPDERRYIAKRITELELWLDSEQSRSATRALIQSETHLFFLIDRAISGVKARIEQKLGGETAQDTKSENEQLMKLTKERRDVVSALEASMKALGMDEAKGGGLRKKMNFQDTLTMAMDGMQRYYSDGDRTLIDFMNTAAEVELLCKPLTLRGPQYRADVVATVYEAQNNFWDREYKPTPIGRMACRRLRAGFEEGLKLIRGESGEVLAAMGEEDAELEADEAVPVESGVSEPGRAGGAGNETLPPPGPPPVQEEESDF